jgi:parallel beta-helix repeat protein
VFSAATAACPDTQPPSSPSQVSVTGATQTSISLSWARSTDNVGVVAYWITVSPAQPALTAGTSYAVVGLTCGATYTIAITASDAAGNVSSPALVNAASAPCSQAPPAPPPPPPPPPAPAPAPVPSCTGATVGTADDLQAAVNANPGATTFCLTAGTHRLAAYVIPKTGDSFIGQAGAVLNGSKDITALFTVSGGYWVASGQTQQNAVVTGQCASGTACQYADDVFFDDKPLQRVPTLTNLGPGRFYFDYGNDQIWIGDNPAGHKVEAAVATRALKGWQTSAENVTVQGLTVEKFANEAGIGAINGRRSWTVKDCDVLLNHGVGVQAGTILINHIHDNGQLGISFDTTSGLLFDGNEIDRNNYAGFDPNWEAGGIKVLKSSHVTMSNNYVHENKGPGLWADTDNIYITYSGNRIENNSGPGIDHEVSYDATITGNTITGNGFGRGGTLQGAGILLQDSSNVDIYANALSGNNEAIGLTQINRGSGTYGTYTTQNDTIHDNTIGLDGSYTGMADWDNNPSVYTSMGNKWANNHYTAACGNTTPFLWANPGRMSYAQWVADGNDITGNLSFNC